MAEVLIRNIPEETLADLRTAAARKGRSVEAEIIDVLQQNRSASSSPFAGAEALPFANDTSPEDLRVWMGRLGRKFTPQERVAISQWFLSRGTGSGEPMTTEERREGLA